MIRNKSTQGRSERRELIWSNKPRPPRPSYLWRRCWAAVPPCAGSTAGRPGWRSLSSSGSWWWAGWWRPCPAGWWWRPAAAASWPARKTRSSPFPAATAPRPATSPSSEPAAWKQTQCETRGADGDDMMCRMWVMVEVLLDLVCQWSEKPRVNFCKYKTRQ